MESPIKKTPVSADEYIRRYPPKVQAGLKKIREAIKAAAPDAIEVISYGMPAYKYQGMLAYFAAHSHHYGFYPFKSAINAFAKDLAGYEKGPGTVRFPFDKPVPAALIRKMIAFRVKENQEKAVARKAGKALKAKKPAGADPVEAYMKKLSHPMKAEAEALRKIIKNANPKLSERIKWNAPSYYYKDDIVTFGPQRKSKILLVFHHPAIVKIKSGLLEGDYRDRRLMYLDSMKAIRSAKKELERILNELVKAIDKK